MTQFIVFRAPKNSGDLVFEAPTSLGGSLTAITTSLTQDPALTVTLVALTASHPKTFTFAQQPELTVASDPLLTFALTQTPVMEIWAATELLSIGELTQDPTLAYIKRDVNTYAIAQAPLLDITILPVLASGHSTYFVNAIFAQAPALTIQRGSQTHFSFTQHPSLSYGITLDIGGELVTPLAFDLVQRPSLDATLEANRLGGAHSVGGWLDVIPYPRQPTKAELRLQAKEKEKEARKQLAILAAERIKQDEDRRAAEIARINALVQQMDAVDAAFRPQYEQQIQQLQQALMAQEQEIAMLRQRVAQTLQ